MNSAITASAAEAVMAELEMLHQTIHLPKKKYTYKKMHEKKNTYHISETKVVMTQFEMLQQTVQLETIHVPWIP